MEDVRTDPRLLEALQSASKARLTSEERFRQRVSFIMGSLGDDSTITRERVKAVLEEKEIKNKH